MFGAAASFPYLAFLQVQSVEVTVPREVFRQVLERIGEFHPAPG
jgi:hypothetical protein